MKFASYRNHVLVAKAHKFYKRASLIFASAKRFLVCRWAIVLGFLGWVVAGLGAFGQDLRFKPTQDLSSSSQKSRWIYNQNHLIFESTQYATGWPEDSRLGNSQKTELQTKNRLRLGRDSSSLEGTLNLTAARLWNWEVSQLGLNELYVEKSWVVGDPGSSSRWRWALGRKIESWSLVDEEWNLGLWEPKFALDGLRPHRQGLTGFFLGYSGAKNSVHFLAAPVFVPTMTPEIRAENDSLEARSRWYRSPARSTNIFGKEIRVAYSIEDVNLSELVNNPGAAVSWESQWTSSLRSRMSLGYKPINLLSLKYRRDLITKPQSPNGKARMGPVVDYHQIFSMDLSQSFSRWKISTSYLMDEPRKSLPVKTSNTQRIDWIQQQPQPIQVYGLAVSTLVSERVRAGWDYLRVYVDTTVDRDASGVQRGSLFPYRQDFTNSFRSRLWVDWSSQWTSEHAWIRDEDQRGDILTTRLDWKSRRKWAFFGGFDVLAMDDATRENQDQRFINQFRMNDRAYLGASYALD